MGTAEVANSTGMELKKRKRGCGWVACGVEGIRAGVVIYRGKG